MTRPLPGWRGHHRQLKAVSARSQEALEGSGREGGQRTAAQPWVDEQVGKTRPAGVHGVAKAATAESHGLGVMLERTLGHVRSKIRRYGGRLVHRRRHLESLETRLAGAPKPEVADESSRSAWAMAGLLVGLCVASAGLDSVVFEVLGLGTLATWAIALAAGAAQVWGAFDIGSHLRNRLDGHASGKHLLVPILAGVTALGMGLATAALRASKMVTEGKVIGLPTPSFMVGFLAFAAVSLVIDAAALGVGARFGSHAVRQQLVTHRNTNMLARRIRWHRRLTERARGKFLAAAEMALGQLRGIENLIYKAANERSVEHASHHEGACLALDAPAGAALADQHEAHPHPDQAIVEFWRARCRAAEVELVALVEHYDEALEIVTPEGANAPLRLVGEGEAAA
jgi:hypothetical protein